MERVCIICGKAVADGDDLLDRFGVHHDVHASCWPEITHLTIELESEKAKRGAIIEKAAKVVEDTMLTYPSGQSASDDVAAEIRALATEADTAALAEIIKQAVDAETRACAEVVRSAIPNIPPDGPTNDECRIVYEELGGAMTAILARIDQRKEAGE